MSMTHKEQMDLGKAIRNEDWKQVVQMLKNDGYTIDTISIMLKKFGLTREDVEFYY